MRRAREEQVAKLGIQAERGLQIGHVQESPTRIRSEPTLVERDQWTTRTSAETIDTTPIHVPIPRPTSSTHLSVTLSYPSLRVSINRRAHLLSRSVTSKIRTDVVSRASRATNKADPYQEEPKTLCKHQTGRVSGLVHPRRLMTSCALGLRRDEIVTDSTTRIGNIYKEDADWLQDLPSKRPSLPATNKLCIEAPKKKNGHELELA
ncbi:BZ3500_MvSof-1268-A1-R1_Chr6-3g08942 [Microbotryum saponariae]|uniref:BZ3500_MvSof-1268-A1-R1_Chr6-3g08942 protein n=1 Tax=Microbotryum saponariae TaxID=289078 RepID=A0A2X0MPN2_9BASI|nr:BZ3500_MvSof-1268-A1-R1_Chr6-3g08942 [Microbotryum saponariae]SDA07544.1 BZ3501_MvSof-1269-A2-R1_Chr6-2g08646 [Microbotryum saponariae]